ncbi:hypothetical protein OG884_12380 [Streptosporangium sp. NBC_01755]|uniref:hypothetical protein n=1 Tax=unclassified Streptosporangium TaxID=2632669 RepID=UPI002DD93DD3|nr:MULTISPECIES: hypothetical protein [unclassified Streptosporangium]WSA25954.1 hypothetical protein OIE13_34495 [Streptosporangium sp. NBC_01810]WSD02657.1 hypothetical protein OG884_12380 [Streptosporangium sp. NBC_01755]
MSDDVLEAELRRAVELFDPVPSDLLQLAVEAYALRMLDAELAELAFDSLSEPSRVRGEGQPRLLTFQGAGLTVDLEVTVTAGGGRVVGQLMPPRPAEVELLGHHPVALAVDELGRFVHDDVPAGPFSLRCHLAGATVVTEWITL